MAFSPAYTAGFAHALREARAELLERHFDHLRELQELRAELDELRNILALVTSTLRQQAETDVATLRRRLEIALARLERDPTRPLN